MTGKEPLNFLGTWMTESGKIAIVNRYHPGTSYPWSGTVADARGIRVPADWDANGNERWDPNLNLKQRKRSEEDKTFPKGDTI